MPESKPHIIPSVYLANYCNEDGTATEKFIAYHEHKAKGGWGLIITEDYAVTKTAGGLEIEESKVLARLVQEAGADCIHCSQGVYASTHVIIPPYVVPRAAYVENAAEIKKVVDIPVIVAVGVRTDRNLLDQIEDANYKVICVGDANGVKNGYLGIREGYEAGLNA